MFSVVFAL